MPPPRGITVISLTVVPDVGEVPFTVTANGFAYLRAGKPASGFTIYVYANSVFQASAVCGSAGDFSVKLPTITAAGTYSVYAQSAKPVVTSNVVTVAAVNPPVPPPPPPSPGLTISRTIVAKDFPSYTMGNVAVSPNVIVADYSCNTPYLSIDGGTTWKNNPFVPNAPNGYGYARGDQWATIDANGKVIVATAYNPDFTDANHLNPAYVYWFDGVNWQIGGAYASYSDVYTYPDGSTTTSCVPGLAVPADYARIACDTNPNSPYKGNLYIAANAPVQAFGSCVLQNVFYRSTDGGLTWDKHLILTPKGVADFGFIERVNIGPDGTIYLAKVNNVPPTFGIDLYISKDGGATFTTTNIVLPAGLTCNIHGPSIAVQGSTVYMAFVGGTTFPIFGPCDPTKVAVYLMSSPDGGKNWIAPQVISEPGAVVNYGAVPNYPYAPAGPEASFVTMCATPTRVFVAWRDWKDSPPGTYQVDNYAGNDVTYPHANHSGDYYAYDSQFGIVRLTTQTGRFCQQGTNPNCADCTTFGGGVVWMDAVASGETVYIVYGVDADGDGTPDGNFLKLVSN